MAAFNYSQVRKGMVIVGDDGQLYSVIDRDLNTPGNWRAILNLKLKNLKTGAVNPRRFTKGNTPIPQKRKLRHRANIDTKASDYSQVRKGMVIVGDDGQLYSVIDRDLNTPGNWRAILNLKLKNLKTGAVNPRRFKPEDKVEVAFLDKRPMQYLYQEGDDYVFMDKETFDQITLDQRVGRRTDPLPQGKRRRPGDLL